MALPLSYGANWIVAFWVYRWPGGMHRQGKGDGVEWRGARGAGGRTPGVFVTLNVY